MNLKKRLILSFGLILFISWGIITIWIWHETNEQMEIMKNPLLSDVEKLSMIQFEINEIFLAVTLPSFLVIFITGFLIIFITNRFLKPFIELAEQLAKKNESNLTEIDISASSKESEIIIQRLNQLLERVTERIEYEKLFTADVAHELRTPLAGMRLTIELMDDVPEKTLLLMRIDELLITIKQLLQFARANHELNSGQAYSFNVNEEIIIPLRAEYEEHYPNPIEWHVPDDLTLKGDPSLICLLMKNLLDNAKFYAANGKTTQVTFQQNKNRIELIIQDNGQGMNEEQLSIMTQRYKRADQTRSGFGLGLNIVERIVHAHDAKMTIANRTDGETGLRIVIRFNQ